MQLDIEITKTMIPINTFLPDIPDCIFKYVHLNTSYIVVMTAETVKSLFYDALLKAFATASIIPLLLYVAPETASTSED